MLRVDAAEFYRVLSWLRDIREQIDKNGPEHLRTRILAYDNPRRVELHRGIVEDAKSLCNSLEVLGARVTGISARKLVEQVEMNCTFAMLQRIIDEINSRIKDELQLVQMFVLGQDKEKYFSEGAQNFGLPVATKFPAAAYEIDEAGKCFALNRGTATVFHLMRAMEVGIGAVRRCLSIADPTKVADRNWGHILKSIKDDLDAHAGSTPTKTWAIAGDKDFFDSAYASLDAVRVAWRNPTMHVENKYTDDEAEHIFVAVKGFMMKLASRCDENGLPVA